MSDVATPTKPITKEAPKEPRVLMIPPQRVNLSEAVRQDWVADIEFGHTVNDIRNPNYWAHKAPYFKPYDHIEARAEDGGWIAHLIVVAVGKAYAKVAVDRVIQLSSNDNAVVLANSQASADNKIEWKGPHRKYCVIRVADGEVLKEQCDTKEEAHLWMLDFERRV